MLYTPRSNLRSGRTTAGSRSYGTRNSRTGTSAAKPSASKKRKSGLFGVNNLDLKTVIIIVEAVIILLLLISPSCSGGCSGCSPADIGSKESIENVLTEFQYSCNTLDLRAMLNCIDPHVSDPIKLSVGLYGAINDVESEDLLENLSLAITGEHIEEVDEFYRSISIEVLSTKASGSYGSVFTTIRFTLFGERIVRDATFDMVKDHGKWYISYFTMDI